MAALANLIFFAALVASPATPVEQVKASAVNPTDVPTIVSGIQSCVDSLSQSGIDEKLFADRGFRPAFLRGGNDQEKKDTSRFTLFNRDNMIAFLERDQEDVGRVCNLSARVDAVSLFPILIESISTALKSSPKRISKTELRWTSDSRSVHLTTTDDWAGPAARIAVTYLSQETQ